jgi:hypothetical protein
MIILNESISKAFSGDAVGGIRIATVFVAFATFCSSTFFSFAILLHNKTVQKINDDANNRAEMFRELQFSSSNYSVIEFTDRMLIYPESIRYINNFVNKNNISYHMILSTITTDDIKSAKDDYLFLSLKIPFYVIEGKSVSQILIKSIKFERDSLQFVFVSPLDIEANAYVLYNEITKRNNAIMNIVVPKSGDFFTSNGENNFSKIKMQLSIISFLGVEIKGEVELFFTNRGKIESPDSNAYQINSSNFTMTQAPKISNKNNYYS